MLTAVVGTNWGDEGKGRMVDLLSEKYDIVIRYQGGNNAGHTVVNEKGKFILNLLPSGILRDETVNVMGPGRITRCVTFWKRTDWQTKNSVPPDAVSRRSMPTNI